MSSIPLRVLGYGVRLLFVGKLSFGLCTNSMLEENLLTFVLIKKSDEIVNILFIF